MSNTLKSIIAIITLAILATILAIFIASKVKPYTPPSPNIIKTDQGSFELKLTNNNGFYAKNKDYSFAEYLEYEGYAKDYYSRISNLIKNSNLIINQYVSYPGDGLLSPTATLYILDNKNQPLLTSIYIYNNNTRKYEYKGFLQSNYEGVPKQIPLDQLLQTPEYQNLKLN